jgi:hypothetical protein
MTATSTRTSRNGVAMWPSVRPQASAVETGRVLERDAGHATGTYIWARASSLNRVAHSLEVSEVRRLTSRRYDGLRVSITGEGITARGLVTGDFGNQPPVGIVRQPGHPRDLVGTYWAGVYLISEHFHQSLRDIGASGWFATPIQVDGVQSQLRLLSISGRCGPMFGVGGDPYPGIPDIGTFIDPARWDGSDFFMADNNHEILIVSATAKRLRELRLSNVVLEEAGLESVRSS